MKKKLNVCTGASWHGDVRRQWMEPNRKLYDYELVFFSKGVCRVITEQHIFHCDTNSVIIIPPCHEHCTIADTASTRWCIHFDWFGSCPAYLNNRDRLAISGNHSAFDPAFAADTYQCGNIKFPVCIRLSAENGVHLLNLMRGYFSVFPENQIDHLHQKGMFMQILALVMKSASSSIPVKNNYNNVFLAGKRYLDTHFSNQELEIRQVASQLQITPNHLNKLFRKHLDISPSNYLLTRRLLFAGELLLNSRKTVREIAFDSGFADANYFIRCFKNKNGITPRKFREQPEN